MASLEDVNAKVEDLTKQLGELGAGRVTVRLPPHRRLSKFGGRAEESVYDWITDARSIIASVPEADQINFIQSFLEGEARDEIKFAAETDKNTVEKCFDILKKFFGEKRKNAKLKKLLYDRVQGKGESFEKFTRALLSLCERIEETVEIKDKMLCEVLVENTSDMAVRLSLENKVHSDPSIKFSALREEGIRRARAEAMKEEHKASRHVHEVHASDNPEEVSASGVALQSLASVMHEFVQAQREMTDRMTQQQGQILSLLAQQQAASAASAAHVPQVPAAAQAYPMQTGNSYDVYQTATMNPQMDNRNPQRKRKPGRCWYCGGHGHKQADCQQLKEDRQNGIHGTSLQVRQTVTSNQGNRPVPPLGVGQGGPQHM